MNLRIAAVCFFLWYFLPGLTAAQTAVLKGRVVSGNAKTPLSYAGVSIDTIGTVTDPEGYFTLVVPAGYEELRLKVSHVGYATAFVPFADVALIELEEDINNLNEIVITGTRTPKLLKDSPVLTRVITSRDIEKLNTGSFLSLLEAELPGLEFTSNANVPNINMQGLGGNYVLFLIDGERIAGETRNNIDYELLNPHNIERIEIVKGSLSTLYGSSAIGGVINIITKKSTQAFHLDAATRFGSYGEQQHTVSGGTKRKRFSAHTSALWKRSDNYMLKDREYFRRIYPDTVVSDKILRTKEVEGGKVLNLEQKFGFIFSEKLTSEIKGTLLHRERFNAGAEGTVMHNLYSGYNALMKSHWLISEGHSTELSYNFSLYDKINHYHRIGLKEKDYTNVLHNFRLLSSNRLTKKQQLTSGVEYLGESLSTYMFADGARSAVKSYTVYTQHDYAIVRRLNLVTGVRWDKHSDYGGNLSPTASAKFDLSDRMSLRASYASGFRSPSLKELYTNWDHLGMFQIIGNPDLRPEKSRTVSVTADYGDKNFYLSINAFHNHIRDKLNLLWNAASDTVFYHNSERQLLKGVEINTTISPFKNLRIQAGYTYTDDGLTEHSKNLSTTRPHTANLKVDYTLAWRQHRATVALNGKFLGKAEVYTQESENRYYKIEYPHYSTWRLHISGRYRQYLTLGAGVNNIFNYTPEVNSFYSSLSPGRTWFASLSVSIDKLFAR